MKRGKYTRIRFVKATAKIRWELAQQHQRQQAQDQRLSVLQAHYHTTPRETDTWQSVLSSVQEQISIPAFQMLSPLTLSKIVTGLSELVSAKSDVLWLLQATNN